MFQSAANDKLLEYIHSISDSSNQPQVVSYYKEGVHPLSKRAIEFFTEWEASVDECKQKIDERIKEAIINKMRIQSLYLHQEEALIAAIRDKKHLCVSTATSSGKNKIKFEKR